MDLRLLATDVTTKKMPAGCFFQLSSSSVAASVVKAQFRSLKCISPSSVTAVRKVGSRKLRVSAAVTATPETQQPAPIKQQKEVRIVKITDDVFTIRGKCDERLKFEIEYGLKSGTTENSYLIKGPDGTALIDVPDQSFEEAFVRAISGELDLAKLTHLVLGHLSPKRVKPLEALIKARPENAPPLEIYCSNPASKTLEAALSAPAFQTIKLNVVKGSESLDLGGGHKLQFVLCPTPRWPDSMITYDPASQLIFTQKFFSCHFNCDDDLDIGGWEKYGTHWKFFYDCMMAPVAKQVESALDKVKIVGQFSAPSYSGKTGLDLVKADLGFIWSAVARALNLSISQSAALNRLPSQSSSFVAAALCPLHGPIVRSTLTELLREYNQWTVEKVQQVDTASVAVIYASAYGNTSAMAQAISRGILKAGVGCETVNAEFSSSAELARLVQRSAAFVIGSPTLGGHMPTPVQEALGALLNDAGQARGKPCGVFGSYGWSGEAVDELEQRLRDAGYSFAFPAIRCKFKPSEQMVQTCEESGTDLAQLVKRNLRRAKAKEVVSTITATSTADQAVGRIVGALCVVSARSGDAESAMLASWVSQASFSPPGITLAVAKERAIEGLVLPGGKFVLNILGGDKVGPVSKQLLKPFKPGEPRFGDLETLEAPCGGRILKDSIAFLECTVESRMDTGDHWVLYATVSNGNLQDDKALTAVHHRKSGSRY